MRFALLVFVIACQSGSPMPAPPAPAGPVANRVDAATPAAPATVTTKTECMSDERQWGTTCCRITSEGGRRHWMSCRGPQLGKVCHRKSDCDIACSCDRNLVHHDGRTGVTGHCSGDKPSGEWLCELDDDGKVTSLIID